MEADDWEAAEDAAPGGDTAELAVTEEAGGLRLDKALAMAAAGLPGLSRSRIAEALAAGRVTGPEGAPVTDPRRKARAGEVYRVALPPPAPAEPEPEDIPLAVVYEDAHVIVIDKPAGMVVHPAPGAETGTMVNALLHHCGDTLAGIGGERRPGIVHRIDKDTSGLIVAAKTEAALAGLSALFAAHDIEREYLAVCHGVPDRAEPRLMGLPGVSAEPGGWLRIEAPIARHPSDRKRMAVRTGGRRAVTRLRTLEAFDGVAALLACRLETGRTHQIRVHAAHLGHPLVGDPVYGRKGAPRGGAGPEAAEALAGFPRQALHAARLGFRHPATGEEMVFETAPPGDFEELVVRLRRNRSRER